MKAVDARGTSAPSPPRPWHAMEAEEAVRLLDTRTGGLSPDEARRRLAVHGPNRLPAARPPSLLRRLAAQFNNVLIYVLLVSAAITALLGHAVDTGVILAVVVANATIGFIQEGRAERALEALRSMVTLNASVMRGGRRTVIAAEELVPGDIVLLEAGDRVPADLRLVRARNLRIDEALLTGESVPASKDVSPVASELPLGDRKSMAWSGALVVAGHGMGVVVATGAATELGKISTLLGTVERLTTPLVRQMNRFSRQLTAIILVLAAGVFAMAVLARGYRLADGFIAVVGLAVAAIPEGLPAVMTITLAIGVQRMAARNAIIRKLPVVETLGSVSVICSDKTGTLTRNEMTVRRAVVTSGPVDIEGEGYEPRGGLSRGGDPLGPGEDPLLTELAVAALLCNDARLEKRGADWTVAGDPMEGALVSFALKAGLDAEETPKQMVRIDEIPFDSEHRFMATLHAPRDGGKRVYLKGAPERVMRMCTAELGDGDPEPLNRERWHAAVHELGSEGYRVLALATRTLPKEDTQELRFADVESDLVFLGLVGLIDPPREEAIRAVAECHRAGIDVKMITGDHAATAAAIGRQLGLADHDRVTTGEELEACDDDALRELVAHTGVFARVSPEHKLRIVAALQAEGRIVAMTGDGVNDAPALKRADVGIAMGKKGTEAAKEAADMILADDNFASIVAAVREGRTVYDNLKKVIGWTLPTNGGEAFLIVAAILFGLTLPVTPVQILWINLVTAIALGLTLAFEPTEPTAMSRPPRKPDEPLVSAFLAWRVVFVSALFVAGAFGMFFWAGARGLPIEQARTIVVNTIIVLEIFYLFSVRYLHMTSLTLRGMLGTRAVIIGVSATVLAQLAFTYTPVMQWLFRTQAVSFADGAIVVAIGILLLIVLEVEKLVSRAVVGDVRS